uniref:Uncharacterized protein C34E10.8 n=1 Tax=Lygus hesperus TaxID=30085 RepID=A0A0A9XJN4_LYGHE
MFLMALVAMFGAGMWLVALCMTAVAAYLAHRVLKIEKYLHHLQTQTQLVRDEVMAVNRVYKPGSAESKKAVGGDSGYHAMASTAVGGANKSTTNTTDSM